MAGPGLGPEGTVGSPGAVPALAKAGDTPAATAAAVRHIARNEAIRGRTGARADNHMETSNDSGNLEVPFAGKVTSPSSHRSRGFGKLEGSERTGSRGSPPTLDSCVGPGPGPGPRPP